MPLTLEEVLHDYISAGSKPKVALDTNCVQYFIGDPPSQPWADILAPIFHAAVNGQLELYVSTVVVSELLSHLHFQHRGTGYDPEVDLINIVNRHFRLLDVNDEVAKAAGRLRGTYAPGDKIVLKTPDALIGGTSLANGHTLFITNDVQLAKALPVGRCVNLKHLAAAWLAQLFPSTCVDTSTTVAAVSKGPGLSSASALDSSELGAIQLAPRTKWERILGDALVVASALNEPCVFFVLLSGKNRKTAEAVECLFWHQDLDAKRPSQWLTKRLRKHLELRYDQDKERYVCATDKYVLVFYFTSLEREQIRQTLSCYASKSDEQKELDAWDEYLRPLWIFKEAFSLPQTNWLLCENGVARYLKSAETLQFLDQAKNVFGWENRR